MSRIPCKHCGTALADENSTVAVIMYENSLLCKYTSEEIWTAQLDDPCIGPLLRNKEISQSPSALLNGTCQDY